MRDDARLAVDRHIHQSQRIEADRPPRGGVADERHDDIRKTLALARKYTVGQRTAWQGMARHLPQLPRQIGKFVFAQGQARTLDDARVETGLETDRQIEMLARQRVRQFRKQTRDALHGWSHMRVAANGEVKRRAQ